MIIRIALDGDANTRPLAIFYCGAVKQVEPSTERVDKREPAHVGRDELKLSFSKLGAELPLQG